MHIQDPGWPEPDDSLTRLALACLDDKDALFESWYERLSDLQLYADMSVDKAELRSMALQVFELLLKSIAGVPIPRSLAGVSTLVGERRAAQGISLDEVQQAANLDFRVVWEALVARMENEDLTSLIEGAPRIWGAVAQHTQRITQSYQRALLESARQFEDQRRDWFTRLLQSGGRAGDVVESAAHVLDFDIEGRFIVVLADRKDGADLRAAREGVRTFGWSHHQQEVDEGDLLVVECAPENDPKLLRWLHRTRCGLAPAARGLSRVPAAVKLASSILAALPAEHRAPGHLKDVWMSIAVAHAPALSTAIAREVLAPLEGVPEATKLLETAREYCYGDGTVASVAQKLFCHRNTVLNRLERFRQLTGHDVRVPHEAALVLLAITTASRQSRQAANSSPR